MYATINYKHISDQYNTIQCTEFIVFDTAPRNNKPRQWM